MVQRTQPQRSCEETNCSKCVCVKSKQKPKQVYWELHWRSNTNFAPLPPRSFVSIATESCQPLFTITNRGAAGAEAVNRLKLIDSFAERRREQPCLGSAPAFFAHVVVLERETKKAVTSRIFVCVCIYSHGGISHCHRCVAEIATASTATLTALLVRCSVGCVLRQKLKEM